MSHVTDSIYVALSGINMCKHMRLCYVPVAFVGRQHKLGFRAQFGEEEQFSRILLWNVAGILMVGDTRI